MKKTGKPSLREFKTLLPYIAQYRYRYALGFLCLLVVDTAQVIIPQFMRQAVNLLSAAGESGEALELRQIFLLCGGMVAMMTLVSLGRFSWRYFIHGSSRGIEAAMRKKLFDHLMELSWDFYQQNKIGDLMSRATYDLNAVRGAIGLGFVALVDGTVMAAAILIIILAQESGTALWAVLPLPLITALILLFGRTVGKRFRRAQETYSAMSDTVQETFAGIRVIKSFVKEWWFIKKFADTNDDYREANMALVKLYGFFFPLITFLSEFTVLVALLTGGIRVVEGSMRPGDLVALFHYLHMLIWPLVGAGFVVNMIQRGAAALGRVNEIMAAVPSIRSPERSGESVPVSPAPLIEIKNLSYAYPRLGSGEEAEAPAAGALEDISLTIEKGTVLGILGRTGSGKSTLIKTLTRMIDPPRERVFIKGRELGRWDLQELRGLFGVVPQDSFLFSDTIRNNIIYGLDSAGDEDFYQAAGLSAIDRDLDAFAQGWDTLIGERGLTLSGGQKQRIALARAFLTKPEILILDDSLSSVDTETERRVLSGLLEGARGKTTILIVSHRVSTLARADKVAVLEEGRIAEYGSPGELASGNGFYARTAALQRLGEGRIPGTEAEEHG